MIDTIVEDEASLGRLAATDAQIHAFERRRAGRQDVSPALVPLLRDPASGLALSNHPAPADTPFRDYLETDPFHDQMAPARGIFLGLSISMMFWGIVGYAIFR
jgi:hypothetical protein